MTRSTFASQISTVTANTEVSEIALKTPKSVRFEEFTQNPVELVPKGEEKQSFNWLLTTRKTWRMMKIALKKLRTRLDSHLITTLMRLGY